MNSPYVQNSKFKAWLWPDRVIGKRASRDYREQYNALLNSHHALLSALSGLVGCHDSGFELCECDKCKAAKVAIQEATII